MSDLSTQANDAANNAALHPQKLIQALSSLLIAEFSEQLSESLKEEIGDVITKIGNIDLKQLATDEKDRLCDALIESTSVDWSTDAPKILEEIVANNPELATRERIARLAAPGVAFQDGNFNATGAGEMLASLIRHNEDIGIRELISTAEPMPVHAHDRQHNDSLA